MAVDKAIKKAREKKDKKSWLVQVYFTLREKHIEVESSCKGPDARKEIKRQYRAWLEEVGEDTERAEQENRVEEGGKK